MRFIHLFSDTKSIFWLMKNNCHRKWCERTDIGNNRKLDLIQKFEWQLKCGAFYSTWINLLTFWNFDCLLRIVRDFAFIQCNAIRKVETLLENSGYQMTLSHTAEKGRKFAKQKSWKTTTMFVFHFPTCAAEMHTAYSHNHTLALNFSVHQFHEMIPKSIFIHSHSFNNEIELIWNCNALSRDAYAHIQLHVM